MALVERACAKVNLTLSVRGRRADGFHELESLVAFASDVADRLELDPRQPPGLDVSGPFGNGLESDSNLVLSALSAVARVFPTATLGRLSLEKNLPVAAGIGGGSADAAAVLRLVQRANPGIADDLPAWQHIAASLGSDVPVCLVNRLSIMTGRGEKVAPIPTCPLPAALLVNPRVTVPANKTAAVFKAWSASRTAPREPRAGPSIRLGEMNCAGLTAALENTPNDLEPAACKIMPAIDTVLSALAGMPGAGMVRLSGAGPTCYALFDRIDTARQAGQTLAERHPTWWIAPTTLM